MSAPANSQLNRRSRIGEAEFAIAIISLPVRAGDDHDRRQSAHFFNGLLVTAGGLRYSSRRARKSLEVWCATS